MAGTLTISQLSDGTNSTSSTNCIQGSAKAWVNFNGTNGAVRAQYNVSSVTRTTAGTYTVAMTNALSDANYSVAGQCANAVDTAANTSRSIGVPVYAAGSFTLITTIGTASANDFTFVTCAVFR